MTQPRDKCPRGICRADCEYHGEPTAGDIARLVCEAWATPIRSFARRRAGEDESMADPVSIELDIDAGLLNVLRFALRELLRREWVKPEGWPHEVCITCNGIRDDGLGHHNECEADACLTLAGYETAESRESARERMRAK